MVHVRRIIMPFPGPYAGPMNPMSHRFGPPQMPPQFPPVQNQMNFLPSPQMTQVRLPFQPAPQMPFQNQNVQPQQQQIPPFPAQMMTPPRPEVPQFRLINPVPQQMPQMPNFERPQQESQETQSMPQPEVRIQLRRIQIPGPISDIFPFLNNIQNDIQKEVEAPRDSNNNAQIQQVPLALALSKVGITPDDLRNIQRMAEEKFQQHFRELVADETDSDSSSGEPYSDEVESSGMMNTEMPDSDEKMSSRQESQDLSKSEERPEILALGRSNFGRSLNPIQLPIRPEIQETERSSSSCKFINFKFLCIVYNIVNFFCSCSTATINFKHL